MARPDPRVPCWPGMPVAREIAAAAGNRSVGTQHVLLALLRRRGTDAAAVLRTAGLDEATAAAALSGIAGTGCRPGAVPTERVTVSPRVLALIRGAARPGSDAVDDLGVLAALVSDDEPSLAQLVLSSLGARRRVRQALGARRVDDAGGDLVGA